MAAYALLGLIWLAVMNQFLGAMKPRLDHVGPGGAMIIDRPCDSPECDFSAFWPAGLLARAHLAPQTYQQEKFLKFRRALLAPDVPPVRWFYPPPTLLPAAAVSFLPFEAAFWAWSIGLTVLAVSLLRRAALPWPVISTALLSPAALWNLELGQLGIFMAGSLVSGLMLAGTEPLLAGGILGMLVLKPQSGITVLIALAARNWRAFLAFVATMAGILLLTVILFGWPVWYEYLTHGLAVSRAMLTAPARESGDHAFRVSVFWMLRNFGAGLSVSYAAQSLATLASACLTWVVWRGTRFTRVERMALTVFLSLLATPYGYTDDMVAWSIALAALAHAKRWRINLLDALFWLWPALCPVVFMKTGMLFTPIVVLAAILRMRPLWPRGTAVLPRPV